MCGSNKKAETRFFALLLWLSGKFVIFYFTTEITSRLRQCKFNPQMQLIIYKKFNVLTV